MVSILGEGSFHQVHGGTTTNDGANDDRRTKIFAYGALYEELRGRLLRGPAKPMHYVGTLATDGARRTRSRRMTAPAFREPAHVARTRRPSGRSGADPRRAQVHAHRDVLAWAVVEGHDLARPTDRRRTDRSLRLPGADLDRTSRLDHRDRNRGRWPRAVPRVGLRAPRPRPRRLDQRASQLRAPSTPASTTSKRRRTTSGPANGSGELTGDDPRALVILGSASAAPRIVQEFQALAPLVPGRVLRRRREHDRERASRLARVRPGPDRGSAQDPGARRRLRPGHRHGRSTA